MRILHYFLGFERGGGLNRYVADLAIAQNAAGHEVFALFSQGSLNFMRRPGIVRITEYQNISCFALRGGIPVPLLEGVADPEMILSHPKLNVSEINKFCNEVKPEILHVHSWMGFPPELLNELKIRGTKVIFTTHDYFGLCPKVNFIDNDKNICQNPDDSACSSCNISAPGKLELLLRNNPSLLKIKSLLRPLVKLIQRKKHGKPDIANVVRNYRDLHLYYCNLLKMCDRIHCNSDVTASVYRKFLPELPMQIIPITHSGISDRRQKKNIDPRKIRLTYSGSFAPYKGLPMLLEVLQELQRENCDNWELNAWGDLEKKQSCANVCFRGMYRQQDLKDVMAETDLLIVPSICFETFGFIVAEALSYGVPVLCSDTVGAQILVSPEMVYHGKTGLYEKLKEILNDPGLLEKENARILAGSALESVESHAKKIIDLYKSC